MISCAIILFAIGAVAALLGFGGLGATAVGVAGGLIFFKVIGIVLVLTAIVMIIRGGASRRLTS